MRERIFLYFLLGLTGFFVCLALIMLLPFLKPILWALIFALVAYPLHLKLSKKIRNTPSALLLTLLVFLLVVIPFSMVLAIAIRQSIELLHFMLNMLQENSYETLLRNLYENRYISRFLTQEELKSLLDYIQSEGFKNLLLSGLRDMAQKGVNLLASLVPAVASFVFKAFVFLLTFFFILRDGPKFAKFIERFLPMHSEDVEQVFLTVYKTVLATVYGSVGVALLQGFLGFIGYSLVGIDYALLLGIATFLSSFVPPLGASFVWFPVALYTFFQKSHQAGIFLFFYGLLLISTADNIARPLIMKMGIDIPYIVLFFSILGGLIAFGFVGIFLGPIIFTSLFTIALIYEKRVLKGG